MDHVVVLADDRSRDLKIYCPLCSSIFVDPYITTCGHTFCLKCVKKSTTNTCPLDGIQLNPVVRNIAVFEQVGELLVHCRYGCKLSDTSDGIYEVDESGCPAVIKMCDKESHELTCDFSLVSCPNSSQCPKMLKKDLPEHLKSCRNLHCPHHKYGCQFAGDQVSISHHLKECKFEGVKDYLESLDETVVDLKSDIVKRDKIIEDLKMTVDGLNKRLEQLEKHAGTKRMEQIEDQYSRLSKDLSKTSNSFDFLMSKLTLVEQQLGLNSIELQHLFKCHGTFVGHKGPIWSLCMAEDLLFSASSDYTIKVWNLSATYEGPRTITGHDGIVLAVTARGDYLYSGSSDKTIKQWNIKTLQLENSFTAHDDPICALATSTDRLFSGSLKAIKVWDLSDHHKLLKTFPTQNHWVRSLVAMGKYLYSGSYRSVKIWNIETMEVAHVLQCSGGSVYSLALTNRYIICGTYENVIHIWNIETLDEVATLSGHVGTVYSLAILPSTGGQTRLFSASYDKSIRVWNLDLMTCSQTMSRHEGSVTCLTVSRGRILSGSVDSTIKIWQ